ncbi:hypothetical protein JCM13664_05050 [Methylothermus subterraneus]
MTSLLQWLKRLEAETQNLGRVLEGEQAALKERNMGTLPEWVAEKNAAVDRINALLERLPQHSGRPQPSFTMQALIAELEGGRQAEAYALWRRIRRNTARCRQLNEANGAIIAVLQEHNRQLLGLLCNQPPQLGYGADGRLVQADALRLLGAT